MNKAVLDADVLSAIMRQDATALSQAQAYLSSFSQLTISIITRYEILRGLSAKNATSQAAAFDAMVEAGLHLIAAFTLPNSQSRHVDIYAVPGR